MAEIEKKKKKTKANRAWEKELQDKEEKIRGFFLLRTQMVLLCHTL